MKNLYILILLIFSESLVAQTNLQNANWVFGDNAWLDFNNGLVTPQQFLPVIAPFNREGVASVSDLNGNIVFWTDGETVRGLDNSGNPFVYTNGTGLFGDESSSQNVVIIPRPNHPGIFYIVSITGYTTFGPGAIQGLYYSEVNTLLNEVTPGIRNIPLRDPLGTLIDNSYGNISESITVTTADDGTYWVVTHVQNGASSRVLSYSVNENGIGPGGNRMPSFISGVPNNTNTPSLVLKISPNRTTIALARAGINPIIGTFTDGAVNFNLAPIGNTNPAVAGACYGVEFSPDNHNLYFTRTTTGVIGIDLSNTATEILISNESATYAIQRAINDRLYIAKKGSPTVSVIGNPNDLFNPMYNNAINLNGRTSSVGLPQWVWLSCEPTITLTAPNDNLNNLSSLFVRRLERSNWISASNKISFGDSAFQNGVVYHAGNYVELTPGFDAFSSAQFAAYVRGCTNNTEYVYKNNNSSETLVLEKSFIISPNPSNGYIDLNMGNGSFDKISIFSIDGKMMFDKVIERTDSYNLDISRYASGIYIVNVIGVDGKIYSQKLIKN